jgi:hypothetical protein
MTKFTKSAIVLASALIGFHASAAQACSKITMNPRSLLSINQSNFFHVECHLNPDQDNPEHFRGSCQGNDSNGQA